MNFGEKENFYEKHQYFFQSYSFKFEGLEPILEKKFESIIKRLSGTVSKDSMYILCEEAYFDSHGNENRTNLYSLNFILDSIVAKKPLDIEKYRFTPTKFVQHTQDSCCLISKHILRTYSCLRYYYDTVCCQNCSVDIKDDSNNKSCQNSIHVNRKREADHTLVNPPEVLLPTINQINTQNCENKNNTSIQINQKRKKILYVHDDFREVSVNNNTDNYDSSNDSENIAAVDEENFDNIEFSSTNTRKKWWTYLPPANSKKYAVMETMFEKECSNRKNKYHINEQRQMIAYLILRNKINEGSTRNVWRGMHIEGYLNNRSVESLRNHYRNTILPNIEEFGLPEDINIKFC